MVIETQTEIEVIKNRMDTNELAISKLGEIAAYLKEIVVEHKTKIDISYQDIHELKLETSQIARDLKMETALIAREAEDKSSRKLELLKESLKENISSAHNDTNSKIDALVENQKDVIKEFKETILYHSKRISALERYKWVIFGGATVMGFLFKLIWDVYSKKL